MNPLISLDHRLLRAMFDGLLVPSQRLSELLLEVIGKRDAEQWRRRACFLQWFLHFSLDKSVAELRNMEAFKAFAEQEHFGLPGLALNSGRVLGWLPISKRDSNVILLWLPRLPSTNASCVYLAISAPYPKSEEELWFQLKEGSISHLKIVDVGASEILEQDELDGLFAEVPRTWINIQNEEMWFRNQKSIITQSIYGYRRKLVNRAGQGL